MSRKYVWIESTDEEKERYKKAAAFDGIPYLGIWFKQLAHNRMKKQKKEAKGSE